MSNWIERDTNPFQLKPPPQWWLTQLAFFDPDLVVFPSAKEAKYRLARRVTNSYGLQAIGQLHNHPDTSFMAAHRMVPVTSFLPTIQWTDEIFVYLRCCDMWGVGGADKAADMLDAKDEQNEAAIAEQFDDAANNRAGSAYRAAKMRLGQTVFVNTNAPSRPLA